MAKRVAIEERIAALSALRELAFEEAWPELRKALRMKTGLIVATAAETIAEIGSGALDDETRAELVASFASMCEDPVRRDPGCRGKLAIARALLDANRWEDAVFEPGLGWVQREPVWGGTEDTGADLRGVCALAYAELMHPDAITLLARVLADPERSARAAAAVALGSSGRAEAIPLLRYKATIADADAEVHSAVLRSLLALDRDSVAFVAGFLSDSIPDDLAEAAALALGESRRDEAFKPLGDWALSDAAGDRRRVEVGFVALAMLRSAPAIDLLIAQVAQAEADNASAALRALAPYCEDRALRERVIAAAGPRADSIAELAGTLIPV